MWTGLCHSHTLCVCSVHSVRVFLCKPRVLQSSRSQEGWQGACWRAIALEKATSLQPLTPWKIQCDPMGSPPTTLPSPFPPLHTTTTTTSFGYPYITPVHAHTQSHTHPPWPNHVVPGHLQPGPNLFFLHPRPSQPIDHCWHISNWAGIDKGQWTGPRGPDTAEKLRTNTACHHIRPVWLRCLSFPCFSLSLSICSNDDRTLVWAEIVSSVAVHQWDISR